MNNGRPTVKLSDINFMPVLVALGVIFLTFGKFKLISIESSLRTDININNYFNFFFFSPILSVEKEISETFAYFINGSM